MVGPVRLLDDNWIGQRGLPGFCTLLRSLSISGLRILWLKDAVLGDAGAKIVAECPCLTNLEELVLDANEIGEEGARAFVSTPHLPKLTILRLDRNPFDWSITCELRQRWGIAWLDRACTASDDPGNRGEQVFGSASVRLMPKRMLAAFRA